MATALDTALRRYPGSCSYRPGDSAALNAEILRLMRAGAKTATCAVPSEFTKASPAPVPGRIDVALDWAGAPALATRTLEVERVRFRDMDWPRVAPQAEFRGLQDWRRGYAAYLGRIGVFDPAMELIWERFELVEDFAEAGPCA